MDGMGNMRPGRAVRRLAVAAMLATAAVVPSTSLVAQEQGQPAPGLYEVLQLDDVIAVLREEGIAGAREIVAGLGSTGAGWSATVVRIYDPERMRLVLRQELTQAMVGQPEATARAMAFFGSALGVQVLGLETGARRTLLDPEAEEAAKLRWNDMVAQGDPRVPLIRRLAEVNDLVEGNVVGTMNSGLWFYRGLAATGGPFADMTEDEMLDLARGKEGENRAKAEDWLFPFLALAYVALSEDDLRAYIAYSDTPEGQVMNTALFAAFNDLFNKISYDLGLAVGREMAGQDI